MIARWIQHWLSLPRRWLGRQAGPAHLRAGKWGEERAARYLASQGYRILGRRVRIGRRDELDIVAREGNTLVFVEVKTRKSETYGRPLTAVDRAKRHTMSRGAVRYLKALSFPRVNFRFDVVEVVGSPEADDPSVHHVRNAFTLDNRYRLP